MTLHELKGLGFAAAAFVMAASSAAAQQTALPEDVRGSIEARIDAGYTVGLAIAIVDAGGTQYHSLGRTRLPDGPAPDSATVFEIGSITKVFTAIALADMALKGHVDLEDPVERFLPDTIPVPAGDGPRITLLDLATHRSALPRIPVNIMPFEDPNDPYAAYTPDKLYAFLGAFQPSRQVGESYQYSNLGYGLLGHALARRAGVDYQTLIVEHITGPLGMEDTGVELNGSMRERLATGYAGELEQGGWHFLDTTAGAGALRSTAADMARFVAANMGLVDSPLRAALDSTHRPRAATASESLRVGLGWHILESENATIVWHNGGTGGYHSFIGFREDGSSGVVVLSNSTHDIDDIGFHLLDAAFPLEEIRVPVEASRDALQRYVGRYQLRPGFVIEVRVRDRRLTAQASGQPEFRLFPASDTRFFLTVVDAEVEFVVDDDGEVGELILYQNGERRARRIE